MTSAKRHAPCPRRRFRHDGMHRRSCAEMAPRLPEMECGICRPDALSTIPVDGLKVRFGIETVDWRGGNCPWPTGIRVVGRRAELAWDRFRSIEIDSPNVTPLVTGVVDQGPPGETVGDVRAAMCLPPCSLRRLPKFAVDVVGRRGGAACRAVLVARAGACWRIFRTAETLKQREPPP